MGVIAALITIILKMDLHQDTNSQSSFLQAIESHIETGNNPGGCVKNTQGIIIVVFVYLLFVWDYFMTLYFGIWHQSFNLADTEQSYSIVGAILNTLFFSFFWVMMMWSHFVTVITKAGYLPKEKEQLKEELFP
jgi:hypothetical protein